MIKAIETRYKGYRFRSRLEARWAVFFDALGLEWEYEREGFQTPSGWYLPDFYLPSIDTWFEVKNAQHTISATEENIYNELATEGKRLIVALGMPSIPEVADPHGCPSNYTTGRMQVFFGFSDDEDGKRYSGWDEGYAFCKCCRCGKIGIEFDGRGARVCGRSCVKGNGEQGANCHHGNGDKCYSSHAEEIVEAYVAALSARFEHGESGVSRG